MSNQTIRYNQKNAHVLADITMHYFINFPISIG
jgi:hypothetical protein